MQQENGPMNLKIEYSVRKGRAKILRCRSGDPVVRLPERVGGFPVCEIGPYAFSPDEAAWRARSAADTGERHAVWIHDAELGAVQQERMLDGGQLTRVVLPDGVGEIGSYAFYNCRKLERLDLTASVNGLAGSVFMNCERLRRLHVRADGETLGCLSALLDDLSHELELTIDYGARGMARLAFPEFYEDAVENVPARIFDYHIRGEGMRYRQCFRDDAFNFAKYDAAFPLASQRAGVKMAVKIAFTRLRSPFRLSDADREVYEDYLRAHDREAAEYALFADDPELPAFAAALGVPGEGSVDRVIEAASRAGKTASVGFLLNYKHARFAAREKTFDL